MAQVHLGKSTVISSGLGLVNAANNKGLTPLHFAAANGYTNICQVLVERGAKVNALTVPPMEETPSQGRTAPLMNMQ
jgi:hypothetical protein